MGFVAVMDAHELFPTSATFILDKSGCSIVSRTIGQSSRQPSEKMRTSFSEDVARRSERSHEGSVAPACDHVHSVANFRMVSAVLPIRTRELVSRM